MNKRSFSITKERGRIHDVTIAGTHIGVKYPVMSILHPSYLMRNPDFENSEGIWTATKKDLKKVFQLLTELEKCS